jgi:hypothetical protein
MPTCIPIAAPEFDHCDTSSDIVDYLKQPLETMSLQEAFALVRLY